MANDLESNIVVRADVTGVESGMARARRSVEDLGTTAEQVGRRTDAGLGGVGKGGDAAARNVERATRSIEQQIQRQIIAMQSGSRESAAYWESIASQRGVNTQALRPLLDQLDAVRAKTEDATAAAKGMERVWEGVGRVAGAAAAGFAAAFSYRKFIDETIQAEQEQAQLAAVLKSTGEAAGWSRDQLNDMADALSSKGGKSVFSAGEINQAQTRLLSYTGIVGTQFPRAMQNVIDMAARMGTDVKSSAETIGRALDIPSEGLTALTRQGFRFTEEQKKLVEQLEATGRAGEAQAIILTALESSYGGAGEAARNTFGGALKALQNTINDLMTGDSRGMEAMRAGVESLVTVLGDPKTREAFQTFVGWLAEASAAVVKLAAAYVAWRQASNKEAILAGVDEFGMLTKNAEAATARVKRLTEQAERYQEAIARGSNVQFNETRLEKTRDLLAQARREAEGAADALKRFANGQDPGKKVTALDFGLTFPQVPDAPRPALTSDANKKADDSYRRLIESIKEKIALEQQELDSGRKLTESERLRVKIEQELTGARKTAALQLVDQWAGLEKSNQAAQDARKSVDELAKAYTEKVRAGERDVASLQQQVQREKDVAAALGLTKQEVAALEIAKLNALATDKERMAMDEEASDSGSRLAKVYRDQAKALRDLAAAKKGTAEKQEAIDVAKEAGDAAKKAAEEWQRYTDDINRSLTDALMRGFENGKGFAENMRDTIVNMFRTMVLKPVVSAVVQPVGNVLSGVVNGLLGGGSVAGGGGNNVLGMASNISGAYNMFTNAGSYASKIGGWFGLGGGGSSASSAAAVNAELFGSAGAQAGGAAAASNGLNVIPIIGWILAGIAASNAMYGKGYSIKGVDTGVDALLTGGVTKVNNKVLNAIGLSDKWADILSGGPLLDKTLDLFGISRGEKRFGGQYSYSAESDQVYNPKRGTYQSGAAGQVQFLEGPSGGEFAQDDVKKLIGTTVEGINGIFKALESDARISDVWAGLEVSTNDKGGVFFGGRTTQGVSFGENDWESTSSRSPNAQQAIENLSLDAQQATIQALKTATDLPKSIAAYLQTLTPESMTSDEIKEALANIGQQAAVIGDFREALKTLPFENLKALSYDTAESLIAAAGGLDALNQNLSGYFSNYYSEEEQRSTAIAATTRAFAELGLTMPSLEQSSDAARAAFRAMVEGIDVTTEAGQKQYAGLLALQGAFAELTPAVEGAASAIARSASDIASERDNLQRQIWNLQGDTSAIRAADLAKLDESNRPLQEQIWAMQDAKAAAEAAAAAQQAWENAVASAAAAQAAAAQKIKEQWQSIGDTLIDEIKRIRGEVTDTGALGYAHLQSQFAITTAQARAGDEKAAEALPQLSQALLEMAKDNASSALSLKQMQLQIAASLEETLKSVATRGGFTVPSLAVGTTFVPGDTLAQLHKGEAVIPAAFNPFTAGSMAGRDNTAMLEELRQLRADNRAQAGEIARLNLRMAKVLEKWDGDGTPPEREEAPV